MNNTMAGLPAGGGRLISGPGSGNQQGFTTNRTMGAPFFNNHQPDYSVRYLFFFIQGSYCFYKI